VFALGGGQFPPGQGNAAWVLKLNFNPKATVVASAGSRHDKSRKMRILKEGKFIGKNRLARQQPHVQKGRGMFLS
jgi:hypothetical protein